MNQFSPSNEQPDRLPSRAEREAAEWFAQIDSGRADLAAFQEWRSADPRNAVAYARIAAAWNALSPTGERVGLTSVTVEPEEPSRTSNSRFSRRAALGSLLGGGAALALGGVMARTAYARESAQTRVGEQRRILLNDGLGLMALNTDSAISWRVGEGQAEFWLDRGEVALSLARGSATKAILHGGGREISLGAGRFNARIIAGLLEVAMLEGRAELAAGQFADEISQSSSSSTVEPGQRVILDATPRIRQMSAQDVDVMLSWPEGELLFHDEPLASAVQEYNRYLDRKILIADQEVGRIRIGGRFTSADPASFVSAIEAGFPVRAMDGADSVILTSR